MTSSMKESLINLGAISNTINFTRITWANLKFLETAEVYLNLLLS